MARAMAVRDTPPTAGIVGMPPTMGGKIDRLWHLREEKRALAAQTKLIEAEMTLIEDALTQKLDAEGINRSAGAIATCGIEEAVIGNVVDWDAFWEYIRKNRAYHLMQRRPSDPAVRELFQLKGPEAVPGVEPFVKRTLTLRSL